MRDLLHAHGRDGIQGCVSCCQEVVFVLAHLDGVQPVADGDEERVVGQVIRGLGETKYTIKKQVNTCLMGETSPQRALTSAHPPSDCWD